MLQEWMDKLGIDTREKAFGVGAGVMLMIVFMILAVSHTGVVDVFPK